MEKREHPSDEEISAVHQLFTSGLVSLFNSEKHKYLNDQSVELVLV